MNRKEFFKALGIGVAAAVVAPRALLAVKEKSVLAVDLGTGKQTVITGKGLHHAIQSDREMIAYTGKLGMEEFKDLVINTFNPEPMPDFWDTDYNDLRTSKLRRKGFTYHTHYAQNNNVYQWKRKR